MQRIRVTFGRGEVTKFVGHLDVIRFWERALRRAGLRLAYSEGFNPRPRIVMAAPLPVGFTSDVELMDLYFEDGVTVRDVLVILGREMPSGFTLTSAELVPLEAPSLQSLMAGCSYRVTAVAGERTREDVEAAVQELLDRATLPWTWDRDGETKHLDLRSLIEDVWLEEWRAGEAVLGMRLVHDSHAAGRPEHVTQALGFPGFPHGIHRTGLTLRRATTTQEELAARLRQSARDRERARRGNRPVPVTSAPAAPGGVEC